MRDGLPKLTSALAVRYLVERELGRGGMAAVYLAQDLKHGCHVALKVLHPELAARVCWLGCSTLPYFTRSNAGVCWPSRRTLPFFVRSCAHDWAVFLSPEWLTY